MGPHPNVGVTDDQLYNLSLSMIGTSECNTVYTSKVTVSQFLLTFMGGRPKMDPLHWADGPEWSFALTCGHF